MEKWNLVLYVPAYNVEKSIGEFLQRVLRAAKKLDAKGVRLSALFVVNDGSTDSTLQELKKAQNKFDFLRIIDKKKNDGATAAIFDGMHAALRHAKKSGRLKNSILVRMDSDLEHQPEDLAHLLAPIMDRKVNVCVGYIPFDWRSGKLLTLFNRVIGVAESTEFLQKKIPQFCPGFNAIRADALAKIYPPLSVLSKRFEKEHGTEMLTVDFIILVLARRMGDEIGVVRLSSIEEGRIKRQPKNKLVRYYAYHKNTVDFLRQNV